MTTLKSAPARVAQILNNLRCKRLILNSKTLKFVRIKAVRTRVSPRGQLPRENFGKRSLKNGKEAG